MVSMVVLVGISFNVSVMVDMLLEVIIVLVFCFRLVSVLFSRL